MGGMNGRIVVVQFCADGLIAVDFGLLAPITQHTQGRIDIMKHRMRLRVQALHELTMDIHFWHGAEDVDVKSLQNSVASGSIYTQEA